MYQKYTHLGRTHTVLAGQLTMATSQTRTVPGSSCTVLRNALRYFYASSLSYQWLMSQLWLRFLRYGNLKVCLDAIQILGGNGYINDYPTGRFLRSVQISFGSLFF